MRVPASKAVVALASAADVPQAATAVRTYARAVLDALLWGAVAASSLIIGALAGVIRDWNARLVGLVLGFGAGALVASISFELAEEGFRLGGALAVALGLAAGAIVFYVADGAVDRMGSRGAPRPDCHCCWAHYWTASPSRRCSESASPTATVSACRC